MSSYTGLYVQRLSNGEVHGVQVADPFGHSLALDPKIYVQRQVKPPIEQLPDINDYKPTASVSNISPVVLALADWVNGKEISSESLYRIQQFGYVHPDLNGDLQLTSGGKQALHGNGLV